MALKRLSSHEKCSCVSPDAFQDLRLNYDQRQVLVDVHHKEQLVTREEAEDVAAHVWKWDNKWVKLAVSKDGDTAAGIADILDKYGFNHVTQQIRVLVDAYHKEQLVTKEEAEKVTADIEYLRWWGKKWVEVAVTKDLDAAARIADILDKYGSNDAQYIRVFVDVNRMGQLVTKEEAEENVTNEWRWVFIAVAKDGDTAAGIADILDKYGFDDVAQQIRVLVDIYHKEQLVTKEEAENALSRDSFMWVKVAATKDADTAARMANILDKYGFNDDAPHIRVFVDVYHKEHLVTKEEAEAVAAIVQWEVEFECEWAEIAVTKDGDTAARIADILDKYGINKVAGHIRVLVDVYHKEQLMTKEEAERVSFYFLNMWVWAAVTKDVDTAVRIADILDKYGFNDVAQHIRVLVDAFHKEQLLTRKEAEEAANMRDWRWEDVAVTKDGDTIARIADILEKYGFNDDARYFRGRYKGARRIFQHGSSK